MLMPMRRETQRMGIDWQKKNGTAVKRWCKLIFVSESGFSAFKLLQNMHQLRFVVVAKNAITSFSSII